MAFLPNLELLDYKAWQYFFSIPENKQKYTEALKTQVYRKDLVVETFRQTWGSTSLGFDVDKDNDPMWGGDAMTDAYTTVFFEPLTETYIVFFGDKACYEVQNANEKFLNDLKNHCLASLSVARKEY